jgi:hypothetical protein
MQRKLFLTTTITGLNFNRLYNNNNNNNNNKNNNTNIIRFSNFILLTQQLKEPITESARE